MFKTRFICADDVITALQKRWKSLRDKFRRLLKGLQEEKKSGAGADDVQDDVVWPFFEQMMFLRDTMEYRPTSGNLPSVPPSSEEESAADILTKMCQFSDRASLEVPSPSGEASQATLSTVSHESLESQDILESLESPVLQDVLVPEASEAHHSRQQSETLLPSAGSHKQGTLGSVPSEATSSRGGKRKKKDDGQLILEQLGNVTCAMKTCKPQDDLEMFCFSLLKDMREVPEDRRLTMKIKLMQVVEELKK
ncbi:uncharacterized protein LOC125942912 [Dermacentor silvarum]|uniref:uncharacterized protein LOC125942912 n=1 Tax=Dermacentor silvarum TaxID=543639 RepID=UPI0021019E29|nr:uncharacterized protein LOC125942912 [Dermacentor silvarum]